MPLQTGDVASATALESRGDENKATSFGSASKRQQRQGERKDRKRVERERQQTGDNDLGTCRVLWHVKLTNLQGI